MMYRMKGMLRGRILVIRKFRLRCRIMILNDLELELDLDLDLDGLC